MKYIKKIIAFALFSHITFSCHGESLSQALMLLKAKLLSLTESLDAENREHARIKAISEYLEKLNSIESVSIENIEVKHVEGLDQIKAGMSDACGYFALYYANLCIQALTQKNPQDFLKNHWLKKDDSGGLKSMHDEWKSVIDKTINERFKEAKTIEDLKKPDLPMIGLDYLHKKNTFFKSALEKKQFAYAPASYIISDVEQLCNIFTNEEIQHFLDIENIIKLQKSHLAAAILSIKDHYYTLIYLKYDNQIKAFIVDGLNKTGLIDQPINKIILGGLNQKSNIISCYMEKQFSSILKNWRIVNFGEIRDYINNFLQAFATTITLKNDTIKTMKNVVDEKLKKINNERIFSSSPNLDKELEEELQKINNFLNPKQENKEN